MTSVLHTTLVLLAATVVYAEDAIGTVEGSASNSTESAIVATNGTLRRNITVPQDASTSSLLFWPSTLLTTARLRVPGRYPFPFNLTTILPRRWHFLELHQPRIGGEGNATASVLLHTEQRYITLQFSRITELEVDSDELTYWCFCPNAYVCALPPPVPREPTEESENLAVSLVLMAVLLAAALAALGYVIYYKRTELFRPYEKPIWPALPPPLPLTLEETLEQYKATKNQDTKEISPVNVSEESCPTEDRGSGDAAASRLSCFPHQQRHSCGPQLPSHLTHHESINSLYGIM